MTIHIPIQIIGYFVGVGIFLIGVALGVIMAMDLNSDDLI